MSAPAASVRELPARAEPTARPPTSRDVDPAVLWRLRLSLVSLGLVVVAFRQQAGLVAPDTKADLVLSPGRWLASALQLWDPGSAFGQLQNQAYGYLFPMGPFFWAGQSIGLPDWVVQRLWWSTLLVVAFLGVVRLAGRLDVGSPWTRVVAGVLFALSPRIQSELGATSVEVWPMALAPWVLVPLVRPRGLWSAALSSGVAVLFLGGVNAVASGAALVPAALWLLTRRPARAAWALTWRWLVCVVLATTWWVVPLLVLGRYSPPFLDWIEDASVTTRTASAFESLRGTSHWLAYLVDSAGPVWSAGWDLVTQPVLVLHTAAVLALGLVGLALRDLPHRLFLSLCLVVGLGLLTTGHVGPGGGLGSQELQTLLDGPLAPFRNTHKFDVVVRLAVCLGVAHALTRARAPWAGAGVDAVLRRRVVPGVAVALLLGALAPALVGGLAPRGSYAAVPAYWQDTARWLDRQEEAGSALLLPGSSFARFTWGTTSDEPLQALMDRPVVVRDSVPLGSAGATRLLDGMTSLVESGRGGPGLGEVLARSGVSFVVIRGDLAPSTDAPPPLAVRQALLDSGLRRVATFGPAAGSPVETPSETLNDRLLQPVPAVEVFAVPGGTSVLSARSVEGSVRASGGPEDLVALGDAGLLSGRSVFLSGDGAAVADPAPLRVMTDGQRRRETFFGRSRDNQTETLTADDDDRLGRAAREQTVVDDPSRTTVARWSGVTSVLASSSGSDADATLRLGPGTAPGAAVDGDPATRWTSGRFRSAVGEALEIRTAAPIDPGSVQVAFSTAPPIGAPVTRVRVESEAGAVVAAVRPDDSQHTLPVPAGPTTFVRLVVDAVAPGPVNGVGISSLSVPGVVPERTLVVPEVVDEDLGPDAPDAGEPADAVLLRAGTVARDGCLLVATRPLCTPDLQRAGEEDAGLDRVLRLPGDGRYDVSGTVRGVPGPALDLLLQQPGALTATASSTWVDSAAARPAAAVDDELGTGWVAGEDDTTPTLTVLLPQSRRVRGLQLLVDPALAASRPSRVTVDLGTGPEEHPVDERGYVDLDAAATDRVVVTIVAEDGLRSVEPGTEFAPELPPGLSELRVLGAEDLRRSPDPDAGVALPCGFGPTIDVDGAPVPTSVSGTVSDVLGDRPLTMTPCGSPDGSLALTAGTRRVQVGPVPEFRPESVTLSADPATAPSEQDRPRQPQVVALSPTSADAVVPARTTGVVLSMPQNANPGWSATADGQRLEPVRVDGWAQAWVLPAGPEAVVEIRYAPQSWYVAGLVLGACAALSLVLATVLVWRRRAPAPAALAVHPAATTLGITAAVVALGLVGGLEGAVAAAVTGLAVVVGGRRLPGWAAPALAATAVVTAALLAVASPWPVESAGLDSPLVQACCWVAVAAVVTAGARSLRRPQRATGDSHHR